MPPPSPTLIIDTSSSLGLRVYGLLQRAGLLDIRSRSEHAGRAPRGRPAAAGAPSGDRLLLVDASEAELRQAELPGTHVIHVQQARTRTRTSNLHEASDAARLSALSAELYFEDLLPRIALALATGRFLSAAPARRAAYVAHEDVAIGAAALLASDVETCRPLHLTGPTALSHVELCALLAELFARPVGLEQVAADRLAAELVQRGVGSAEAQLSAQLDRALLFEPREPSHDLAKITGMAPLSPTAILERARGQLEEAASKLNLPALRAAAAASEAARAEPLLVRSAQA